MFSEAGERLVQHRICLERDVSAGIIPAPALTSVDDCFATLYGLLVSARLELEAAGPAAYDHAFAELFVRRYSRLGQRLYRYMYRQADAQKLCCAARQVSSEARTLLADFRIRIARAA